MEYYEITPNCFYKLFMCPFPCFCAGCCISQSTKMEFDNSQRVLIIRTYCGYCCCFAQEQRIPYHEVQTLDARLDAHMRINHQPAFKVWLVWQSGQLELSAGIVLQEAIEI
jgi:hypothetical protein